MHTHEDKACANCGMDMSLASEPNERDGKSYCCLGCARDIGCTC